MRGSGLGFMSRLWQTSTHEHQNPGCRASLNNSLLMYPVVSKGLGRAYLGYSHLEADSCAKAAAFGNKEHNHRESLPQSGGLAAVGIRGSSIEYGRYINRGFDDIDWLEGS